jgi:Ca2+-binding RTX toxin-like protein
VAGVGTQGFSGDGGDATLAELNNPQGVAADAAGNVFIADTLNHRVRRVDAGTGEIDTIAGDGTVLSTGNGGDAGSAQLSYPMGLVLDEDNNLYIFENTGGTIRRIDGTTNIITAAFSGSLGYVEGPYQGAMDAAGNLFIAEANGDRVSVLAVNDTDGDGFPDAIDHFPTVYSKCRTSQATIIGTSGDDNPLDGTSDADVIMGLGGADIINGLEGDDLICGGNGADVISGGDGKDQIYGENGIDTIYGNQKSDRLYGGDNDDVLRGGDGTRDRLYGGDGTDDLDGGAGTDDRCTLGEVNDRCEVFF